jgi:hypothetical protein
VRAVAQSGRVVLGASYLRGHRRTPHRWSRTGWPASCRLASFTSLGSSRGMRAAARRASSRVCSPAPTHVRAASLFSFTAGRGSRVTSNEQGAANHERNGGIAAHEQEPVPGRERVRRAVQRDERLPDLRWEETVDCVPDGVGQRADDERKNEQDPGKGADRSRGMPDDRREPTARSRSPWSARCRSLRVRAAAGPRSSVSDSNRWAAAYTRSIRTMVMRSPSTSYSTR